MHSRTVWSRVTLVVILAILVSAIGMVSPTLADSYMWWYTSDVDGSLQPYGVWIPTTYDPGVPAPVVIHLHGYGGRASSSFSSFQKNWADTNGWILVKADGRREWSNYDHVGELDLYNIIADLKARGYNVDDDRLYLTGCSMGGHGSYREAFRHPDRWAAVAPGAGWTDYRNFFPQYYEHAANIGRASYFQAPWPYNRLDPYYVDPAREPIMETASSLWQVENANWLPLYIMYDTGDNSNPSMNATNVIDKMNEFGYSDHLQVTAGTGGHCASYNLANVYNFFLGKTRVVDPPEVVYTTNSLQYNKAYWVQLDRFSESNKWARLHAEIVAPNTIEVETDYLVQFTLSLNSNLVDMGTPVAVTVDGLSTLIVMPAPSVTFYASLDGANQVASWSTSDTLPGGLVKKEGLSGPIADALLSKFLIVYGTSGTAEETAANLRAAQEMAAEWNNAFILNWRGSGWPPSKVQAGHENDWWIPYDTYPYYYFTGSPRWPTTSAQTIVWPTADTALTAQDMADYNLILYGEPDDNAVIAQIEGDLPFQLSAGQIQVQDRTYSDQPGKPLDYSFIYPNPLNPERYVLVSRIGLFNDWYDAVTGWGGAFAIGTELQSLSFSFPDYIIGWRPTNIAYWSDGWYEAGYFDGAWQFDDDAPSTVAEFAGTPGDDGWYHSGTVSLNAGDALGGFGVAKIEYGIDDGPWTEYTEPFEIYMDDTVAVQYRAVDENGQVLYAVGLPWDGYPSGPQWLGYKAPGNVEGTNVMLVNATQRTVADTQHAYDEGRIDNHGILNSLLQKLNSAQAVLDLGDVEEAIDLLGAYINELEAQSGKHVTAEAAALLIADAQWVIDGLE